MNTPTTFASIVHGFVGIINLIIPILSSVALVFFFVGIVRYLYNASTSKKQNGKALMGWGLVALFVLFSLWGILKVLNDSFFGGQVQHSSGATAGYGGAYGTGNAAENY